MPIVNYLSGNRNTDSEMNIKTRQNTDIKKAGLPTTHEMDFEQIIFGSQRTGYRS